MRETEKDGMEMSGKTLLTGVLLFITVTIDYEVEL